jgi:outer membrane lipoprotein SlyB
LAEHAVNQKDGIQALYQVDGSTNINALVQEQDPENPIQKGDRVRVVSSGASTRLERI